MGINLYALPPLFCSLLIFATGAVILLKNSRAQLNQLFFLLSLSTTVWLFFYSINFLVGYFNEAQNEFIFRLGYCGVAFISITFLSYTSGFIYAKTEKFLFILNLLYGLCLIILIFKTNLIVEGLYKYFWGHYPKAGKLHPYFLAIFISQCSYANLLLIQSLRKEAPKTKKAAQLKYITLGFILFTLACWDFLPNYGFELYPFGYLPATIFTFLVSYAVFRHNLMDITIVINKGLVYSILITVISIIYLLSVLLIERITQNILRYNSIVGSVLAAFVIAIFFTPLKDKIQEIVDRFFIHKSPLELAAENQLLRQNAVQSEKMKTVATLASSIAHEIRNPLTSLKTFVEYFPHKKHDPQFQEKFHAIVTSEVNRIEEILSQLLAFSKPSPLNLKETRVAHVIENALTLTSNSLKENNITVVKNFAPSLPTLKADANKLLQVFLNLILNAQDAMPKGGTLTIASRFTLNHNHPLRHRHRHQQRAPQKNLRPLLQHQRKRNWLRPFHLPKHHRRPRRQNHSGEPDQRGNDV